MVYSSLHWSKSSLSAQAVTCVSGGGGPGQSFVGLSREFGSSITPHLHSYHLSIHYPWTASVEHADSHPAVFPTARAFYSGGSGLLQDSDFVASVTSLSISSLSDSPQYRLRVPISASPSWLPETITQPELQSSSFALTRLFRH